MRYHLDLCYQFVPYMMLKSIFFILTQNREFIGTQNYALLENIYIYHSKNKCEAKMLS